MVRCIGRPCEQSCTCSMAGRQHSVGLPGEQGSICSMTSMHDKAGRKSVTYTGHSQRHAMPLSAGAALLHAPDASQAQSLAGTL
jgi:hypothetical protein